MPTAVRAWGRARTRARLVQSWLMPKPKRTLTVDLHGYDVLGALDLAVTRVAEAYGNGYDSVELVHGAADVREPVESGRGRIKWELRRLVDSGRLQSYASDAWPRDGSILVTLRRNPKPRPEHWSDPPRRAHGR